MELSYNTKDVCNFIELVRRLSDMDSNVLVELQLSIHQILVNRYGIYAQSMIDGNISLDIEDVDLEKSFILTDLLGYDYKKDMLTTDTVYRSGNKSVYVRDTENNIENENCPF